MKGEKDSLKFLEEEQAVDQINTPKSCLCNGKRIEPDEESKERKRKENCALDEMQCESKSTTGLDGDGGLENPLVPKDLALAWTAIDFLLPFKISPGLLTTRKTSWRLTQGAEPAGSLPA